MPTPFEATDLLLHRTVTDLDCSWDEGLIAACTKSINEAEDAPNSSIWIYPANGDAPWPMTESGHSDSYPRWSNDGSQLAFISNRNGSMQLFVIARRGGEARQITQLEGVPTAFEWSPDGKSLLAVVALPVDPDLRGARPGPDAGKPPEDGPEVVWKLPYKADGTGYQLRNENHLLLIEVDSGRATQLTDGPFDIMCATFSADGQRIGYTRSREGDASHRTDVWIMDRDGGNARQLTTELAQVLFPTFSPDGRWLVFCGTVEEGDAQVRMWTIALESGEVRPLGDESIEMSNEASGVQFVGDDSTRVRALISRRGVQAIAEVTVPQGEIKWLVEGDRQLSQLVCSREFMGYTVETPVAPLEVYRCRLDGSDERCLSRLNPWWQERKGATVERKFFDVPDGNGGTERIDGWLIRPEGVEGPTPLLVDVHGGPASFTLFAYAPAAYWSMLWSKGWSILALNAVGSASYGRAFCDRLRGHWGELDLPQHLAAVQALQQQGLANDKVVMVGKSYGGFMSAWAAGHTEVFKAVVPMACLTHIDSHWGTSDSGFYTDTLAMLGEDDEARERMRRHSPVEYLRGSMVPTLFLHGKDDQRCPVGQAETAFVALRRGGNRNCEMVLYPGASHGFTKEAKPSQRIDAMKRIVDWVTRWTQ